MFNPETTPTEQESIDKSFEEFFLFLGKLKKEINNHEITCVLGDDKSARRPALIMGRVINKIYRSRGEEVVPQLFIDPGSIRGALGSRGASVRGIGTKNPERLLFLKQEIKKMFIKSGMRKGKILLISDYVDSGNTLDIFKDIAKENDMGIEIITNEDWYGDYDSGLIDKYNEYEIHSRPLMGNRKHMDVSREVKGVCRVFFEIKNHENIQRMIIRTIKDVENIDGISDTVKVFLKKLTEDIPKNNFTLRDDILYIVNTMTADQAEIFLRQLKKWSVKVFREDIDEISTKLATRFLESD